MIKISSIYPVAKWCWETTGFCGICQNEFEGSCGNCRYSGDDCPLCTNELTSAWKMWSCVSSPLYNKVVDSGKRYLSIRSKDLGKSKLKCHCFFF